MTATASTGACAKQYQWQVLVTDKDVSPLLTFDLNASLWLGWNGEYLCSSSRDW